MSEENTKANANAKANTNANANAEAQAKPGEPFFNIHRLYIKDLSFESPNAPQVFNQDWNPDVNFDLNSNAVHVADNIHEVTVALTITAKAGDKTAFLVEIKHAGQFEISGYQDSELDAILGSVCPGIIFPYLREVISDTVVRGGFPNLYLNPINFDALYAQHVQQEQGEAQETH